MENKTYIVYQLATQCTTDSLNNHVTNTDTIIRIVDAQNEEEAIGKFIKNTELIARFKIKSNVVIHELKNVIRL